MNVQHVWVGSNTDTASVTKQVIALSHWVIESPLCILFHLWAADHILISTLWTEQLSVVDTSELDASATSMYCDEMKWLSGSHRGVPRLVFCAEVVPGSILVGPGLNASVVGYCGLKKWSNDPLCGDSELPKILPGIGQSITACSTCCREFFLSDSSLPGSFIFIYASFLFQHEVRDMWLDSESEFLLLFWWIVFHPDTMFAVGWVLNIKKKLISHINH